ncbi:hypothetical protein HBB16_07555 [Pseudonocardia sp. MCCB 268]|nr:hypothetical protein [Pseudonocardia cytotoxica]
MHTHVDRPDPALVKELSAFSAATIHEAQGRRGASTPRWPVTPEMASRSRVHRHPPAGQHHAAGGDRLPPPVTSSPRRRAATLRPAVSATCSLTPARPRA